ncbi:nucleoside diphosphate kinase [Dethiosulfatarculus sandiegensis]|uniref:Nucleoside diphosphate kinase n=1 Tax=Dethiosulfatarculus sandiegensis TaxID=1429043 RepID=A0A0D2K2I4_9BACT|nr:nucleoside-diphosphate kinase [Dethiosulfatarculus sandiegensis]KIX15855.1 nucleoside diphosphate kinase [Dethiosulfatarculus sandiegensis]
MERTLILIKPDAISRGLAGTVLKRFEQKGLKIAGIKMIALTDALLKEHYSHLVDKPFFPTITEFMSRTPVIAMCLEGLEAVDVCRKLCGVTNSRNADPGTIRGDFGMSMQANLVHASDSVENGKAEVARFFSAEELFEYDPALLNYLYASDERK